MAEEVDELFVSLGVEADQESFQEADSMFNGLRRTAMQFGAAIGTGIGLREMTFGFAEANRELSRFAELFSADPQFVDNLSFAFESITGNADGAFGAISKVADIIEQTDWGEIPSDAFREVGFDPMLLQGVDSMAEAFERLSKATQDMDDESARRALSNLGFSGEEIQVLRGTGDESLSALLDRAGDLRTISEQQLEQSKEFQKAVTEFNRIVQSFLDQWSTDLLQGINEQLRDLNKWLQTNRSTIEKGTDVVKETSQIGFEMLDTIGLSDRLPFGADESPRQQFYRRNPGEVFPTPLQDQLPEWMRPSDPMGDLNRRLQESFEPMGRVQRGGQTVEDNRQFNVTIEGDNQTPEQVERAAERGTRKALEESAENTIQDIGGGPL